MKPSPPPDAGVTRRSLFQSGVRALGVLAAATAGGVAAQGGERQVWQIDPDKCVQCGRCATACVLTPSAVKCVHAHALCGYCDLCTGFFKADAPELTTAAENQMCPTNAIMRRFVEDPYYEYHIDEPACMGCARCVQGCSAYGNGSLFLQIRHDRCTNCNQCAIAQVCPAEAISRVPAAKPYKIKSRPGKA
jgi:Na+-translocating ferredoxin:NAD+ oxidoreductase subunit B